MAKHSLLSASASHRWIACPPSARLSENYEDEPSDYAQAGTDCHELCAYKVEKALGRKVRNPAKKLAFYDAEMDDCSDGYCSFVMECIAQAKKTCADPLVLVEQKLDYSRYVGIEGSFGTGDCVIVADGMLYVIDYKHGLGVMVSAEKNSQLSCYALGALDLFDGLYDIERITLAIYQPRRANISLYEMSKDELLTWAKETLAPPPNWRRKARANSQLVTIVASAAPRQTAASGQNIIWKWPSMTLKCPPRWKTQKLPPSCQGLTT